MESALAVPEAVHDRARVPRTVRPSVGSFALDFVIGEVALVDDPGGPGELALS